MTKKSLVNKVDHFTIDFVVQSNGKIKLLATHRPADPYRGSASQNHVFSDNSICIAAGNAPTTMERARAIAIHWMQGYSVYIRTGTFPNGARRVSV